MNRVGRILVVDDDEGFAALLERLLEDTGHSVAVVHTGSRAVECADRQDHDLILMDIRMPGMDGIEAFREIKQRSPERRIVFMTGYAASGLALESRPGGPVTRLAEPFEPGAVADRIEESALSRGVLTVAPDAAFCGALKRALTQRSLEVLHTRDVEEAIVRFGAQPRRAVILEADILNRSGLIVRELTPTVLVTLLSAAQADGQPSSAPASSASDGSPRLPRVLTKPFDPDLLIQTVQRAIAQR